MGRVNAFFVTLMVIISGALCQNDTCNEWTEWMDGESGGTLDPGSIGEFELIDQLRGPYGFCDEPTDIECALADDTNTPYNETGQVDLTCKLEQGFMCFHSQQSGDCFNYAIRLSCPQPCPTERSTTSAATIDVEDDVLISVAMVAVLITLAMN
ncbi:cartilage intermediate layer protein 1-like [Ptychodera flava]|uniref:cartilage intermediate layer protein 1-like n=1 Tax=Ptychodera flava TaxID=63121 RepID=UPI003969D0B1